MKIKTITCHDVYNYGASLQAYALQTYLTSIGHEYEIIDYLPEYLQHSYKFWYIPENHRFYNLCKSNKLFHLLYSIRLIPITYSTWGRIKPFRRFKKNYLKCTSVKYKSIDDLIYQPPVAEMYIAGSDQIWNCNLHNGKDPSFYLNFGGEKVKRVSYAASFAISDVPKEYKELIKGYLSVFDAISVREETGVSIANGLGYNATRVLDPVFLLSKKDWTDFAGTKPLINGDYILVYQLFTSTKIPGNAIQYAKANNLKIVSVNDKERRPYADINISDAGPVEFVNLILHSKFVMSDSFHATAFSIILNKPFAVYYDKPNSSRIKDCLSIYNLISRYNPETPNITIDWSIVNSMLSVEVNKSKLFITNQLV